MSTKKKSAKKNESLSSVTDFELSSQPAIPWKDHQELKKMILVADTKDKIIEVLACILVNHGMEKSTATMMLQCPTAYAVVVSQMKSAAALGKMFSEDYKQVVKKISPDRSLTQVAKTMVKSYKQSILNFNRSPEFAEMKKTAAQEIDINDDSEEDESWDVEEYDLTNEETAAAAEEVDDSEEDFGKAIMKTKNEQSQHKEMELRRRVKLPS